MKNICFALIVLLLHCFNPVFAQNTAPTWTAISKRIGENSDRFNKIISDGSGNFIGVGYTYRPGNYKDFLTIKFDSNGDTLWWKMKNGKGSGDDELITCGVDPSGNVFVAGYSDENITQNDIRIIKYDPAGVVLWDTTWDSPASLDDIPVDMKVDGFGNCYIGGVVKPDTTTGSRDYITLKYDPNGILLWSQQYSRPLVANGKDELAGLVLDAAGDVYVTGRSFNTLGNDDFITIKYDDTLGTELWVQTFNGGGNDRASCIVADNSGNIDVAGESDNGSNLDFKIIQYNSAGLIQWTHVYGAPVSQDDIPTAIAVDANNNVFITGESDVLVGAGINFDFQTVKYTSAGAFQWAVRTGNIYNQEDRPSAITTDAAGNIFVTGKSDKDVDPLHVDNDFMTVMYNTSGALQWGGLPRYFQGTRPFDDDIAYSLVQDGLGNVYVAGGAIDTITQKNATVVKYDVASGNEVWVKKYNGQGDFSESVKSIVIDANDNSYACGYAFNENNNLDAVIVKVSPTGDTLCRYTYQGAKHDDDEFNQLAISSNGSIYAIGNTKVLGQKRNMLLVKWDPSTCDTIWTWTYDYIGQSDRAESIVLDAAGYIYITGRSDANPVDTSDNYDIVTMKFDSNGNLQWSQRYDGPTGRRDEPTKIILDNNGDVLVAGRTENIHDDDFIVIKYNPSTGAPVWGSPIIWASQHANDDRVDDIAVDDSNNIFVSGFAQSGSGNVPWDAVVHKFSSAGGAPLTSAYLIGDDNDEAVKVAIDISNNVYVLYKFDADGGVPNSNNYDFLLKKFDNNLNEIWTPPYADYDSPVNGDDIPADLTISPAGVILVTGSSENDTLGGHVNNNWVTIGYDGSGAQVFISNYDGPNGTDDSPHAMIVRGSSLWVCGNSEGTGNSQKDITINRYDSIAVGIKEINNSLFATVYPNPFSSECQLFFDQSVSKNSAWLEIFDMLGNSVVNPQLLNGSSARIQRGNLSAGIYEYRIRTNTSLLTHGKLIIN